MDEKDENEVLELLRTRLSINVQTSDVYTCVDSEGNLYTDPQYTVQLLLDDKVISEADIS